MLNTKELEHISYGVYILTTLDGDRPVGAVVNSVMQVTAEPATIAVSIHHDNYTHACVEKTGKFAFSILTEAAPVNLVGIFGFQSSRDTNKFTGVAHEIKQGLPVLTESFGYVICDVIETMETETHTVFLGKVSECGDMDTSSPVMTYDYYHRVYKGKSPKNAPSYVAAKADPKAETGKKTKWVCTVCGYVYEGEELPPGYVCPICGVTTFE